MPSLCVLYLKIGHKLDARSNQAVADWAVAVGHLEQLLKSVFFCSLGNLDSRSDFNGVESTHPRLLVGFVVSSNI